MMMYILFLHYCFFFLWKCDCVIVNYWNNNNNNNNNDDDNDDDDDNNDILKGPCQLESMCAEVMQITFNCQNSIVFNVTFSMLSVTSKAPKFR